MQNNVYTLMHKQLPVVEMEMDLKKGLIQKVLEVVNPDHLPVGVAVKKDIVDCMSLNEWWMDRSIPEYRFGVREFLNTLKLSNTKELLVHCNGLSLSDHYWICPKGSNLSWDEINYFRNSFSEDIGDILFGANEKNDSLDLHSPDVTTDGNLKKRWKVIDGKTCLVKGGSNPYRQQPLNELIATEIMQRLGIPCIPYTVVWDKGAPYSICEDFIGEDTELVPAWRIMLTEKKKNNTSVYQHFVSCAEKLGIPGVVPFLDRMIVLDYIIANEDRHLNNFGAIRDAKTLEWIGMAPIYDSGSSLGYDKIPALMSIRDEIECKPFKKHHEDQLKLVSSFDWVNFESLDGIREWIIEMLSDEKASDYMDTNRITVIARLTEKRIQEVKGIAKAGKQKQEDLPHEDVHVNVAATYEK